ncbi:MAG: hypothetical protein U0798_18590 [Gemmataceae bacterium]
MAETLEIASTSDTTMRHFYVAAGAELTLDRIQLIGGIAQGGDGGDGLGGGGGAGMGGAIFNQGKLNLLNSTLSGNQALGGKGGAVYGLLTNEYAVGVGGGGGMFGDGGQGGVSSGGGGGFFGKGGDGNSTSAGGGGGGTSTAGASASDGGQGGTNNGGNGEIQSPSSSAQDGDFEAAVAVAWRNSSATAATAATAELAEAGVAGAVASAHTEALVASVEEAVAADIMGGMVALAEWWRKRCLEDQWEYCE